MNVLISKIIFIFKDEVIRKKILFILFGFLIFRLFAAIPLPIADLGALQNFFSDNGFLGILNAFSGGGLSGFSIVMLGVIPYITASIIMQLATIIFPKVKELQQEGGDAGRKKVANYSRLLSIPLAAIQAYGFMALLQSQQVLVNLTDWDIAFGILIVVTGAVFLMWVGELITEFGIGNGLSLMIFAGIISVMPATLNLAYESLITDLTLLPTYLAIFISFILMIYAIVYVTEAERPVPVANAKTARAGTKAQGIKSTIPIKLNQAGVIPIIFAVSLISFPQLIIGFLETTQTVIIESGSFLDGLKTFSQEPLYYGIVYFLLVFFFTFFYTAVTFDPKRMAENLAKSGTFVPGVRPGEDTEEYFGKITSRVTFFGATFLALVAVIPIVIGEATGGDNNLIIGGTSILIVVSVGIDLIRKISAQISVREYTNSI